MHVRGRLHRRARRSVCIHPTEARLSVLGQQLAQVAGLVALALELDLGKVLVDGDHPLLMVHQQVVRELGLLPLRLLHLGLRLVLVALTLFPGRWRLAILGDVALLARDLAARLELLVVPAAHARARRPRRASVVRRAQGVGCVGWKKPLEMGVCAIHGGGSGRHTYQAGVPTSRVLKQSRHLEAFFTPDVIRKPSSLGSPPSMRLLVSAPSPADVAALRQQDDGTATVQVRDACVCAIARDARIFYRGRSAHRACSSSTAPHIMG